MQEDGEDDDEDGEDEEDEDEDEEDDDEDGEDDYLLDPQMHQRWWSNALFIGSLQICLRPKIKTNYTRQLFQLVMMMMMRKRRR